MPTPIEKLAVVESELNRIIRGKADVIRHLLTAFVAGGNILLDDVPGVGKTTLA
ncbi:MAG TPA: magnesium chelatase, partial [Lentisphaeria bacterium]|nr:magnesium chelatase [Lentisphaeria bacterium]